MDWRDVPKPPAVAALDVDPRGFPIFFTVQPPPGRPVNFRAVNPDQIIKAARQRLCGICGWFLDYRIWFLGDEEAINDRLFAEPAMHRPCLDYALQVCPFLLGRREPTHAPPADGYLKIATAHPTTEGRMLLFCTRSYKFEVRGAGTRSMELVFTAAPATAIEWRDHGA